MAKEEHQEGFKTGRSLEIEIEKEEGVCLELKELKRNLGRAEHLRASEPQ